MATVLCKQAIVVEGDAAIDFNKCAAVRVQWPRYGTLANHVDFCVAGPFARS